MNLQAFVPTTGRSITLECLARLRKFTPFDFGITIWYDTCGKGYDPEFHKQLFRFTDDVVMLSKNHGLAESLGFALLYLHADYILICFDDCLVTEGYWNRLIKPFDDPKMACVGQANYNFEGEYDISNKNNFPDHTQLFNQKAIDEIGGVCPSFRTYGHDLLEFHYRTLKRGWKYAVHKEIVHLEKEDSVSRDNLVNISDVVGRNINVLEEAMRLDFEGYNWWTNNLFQESCV